MIRKILYFCTPSFIAIYFTEIQRHPNVKKYGLLKAFMIQYSDLFEKINILVSNPIFIFAIAIAFLLVLINWRKSSKIDDSLGVNYSRGLVTGYEQKRTPKKRYIENNPIVERKRVRAEAEVMKGLNHTFEDGKNLEIENFAQR